VLLEEGVQVDEGLVIRVVALDVEQEGPIGGGNVDRVKIEDSIAFDIQVSQQLLHTVPGCGGADHKPLVESGKTGPHVLPRRDVV
jgi:hypothetical protein